MVHDSQRELVPLWDSLWLLCSLFLSTQWHGSPCYFLNMPSMLYLSPLHSMECSPLSCMSYSSMSFKHLFKKVSLIILSRTVALHCNSPSPYPGLFSFTAYINTPNFSLFILCTFSHQIFERLLCVRMF